MMTKFTGVGVGDGDGDAVTDPRGVGETTGRNIPPAHEGYREGMKPG